MQHTSIKTEKYTLSESRLSIELVIHIIFSLLLGQFWLWPWVYKTTDLLNEVKGAEFKKPSSTLACFMLVPFYSFFWFNKAAHRVEELGKQADSNIKFSGLCTFLAFVCPAVASILIQMELEKLSKRELTYSTRVSVPKVSVPKQPPKPQNPPKAPTHTPPRTQADSTIVAEDEIEILCPNCKENLFFMGYEPGSKEKCPFCDAEVII